MRCIMSCIGRFNHLTVWNFLVIDCVFARITFMDSIRDWVPGTWINMNKWNFPVICDNQTSNLHWRRIWKSPYWIIDTCWPNSLYWNDYTILYHHLLFLAIFSSAVSGDKNSIQFLNIMLLDSVMRVNYGDICLTKRSYLGGGGVR